LEEAFLLYAVIDLEYKYNIGLKTFECNRNILVKEACEKFHPIFLKHWSGKLSNVLKTMSSPFCASVLFITKGDTQI
jgi:hypothetical protein